MDLTQKMSFFSVATAHHGIACGKRISVSRSSITKVLSLLLTVNGYENCEIWKRGNGKV